MVRAGSLIYALCITLILSILSGSLILLAFNSRSVIDNDLNQEKQIVNISSALNYYLTNSDQWKQISIITLDLFANGNDSVEIEKRVWGCFDLIFCKAIEGNKHAESIFLVGDKPKRNLTALYLADQNIPLALCGKTVIKGPSFIPTQGVKRAYIEGQNFIGGKLIDGESRTSSKTLPDLDIIIQPETLLQNNLNSPDSIVDIKYLEANKVVSNSFLNRTIRLVSTSDLELDNYELNGNINVQCSGTITIKSSSSINDILIHAQSIVVEKNFTGNFQAFAIDSIVVREDVVLKYPSALFLIPNKGSNPNSIIELRRRSKIKGNVINLNALGTRNKSTSILIAEQCRVDGLVYTMGLVDLKGSIFGSLYCPGFILKTPSGVYENHLLNVVINSTELPDFYVGSFPATDVQRKSMIKRLL